MRPDPRGLLWDAHDAVERQCEVIGEALNRLSKVAPDLAARIPGLSHAVVFRNLPIHGYAVVDDTVVWRTAQEDIPVLARHLAALPAEPDHRG